MKGARALLDFADSRAFVRMQILITVLGLAGGVGAWLAEADALASGLWIATTVLVLVPTTLDALAQVAHERAGVDVIAILAMAGALLYGEYVAGAVIAVMLATGAALEGWAAGRAERDLARLLERAPRVAHRVEGDRITTIPAEEVRPGDRLLVKEADLVPVDGGCRRLGGRA